MVAAARAAGTPRELRVIAWPVVFDGPPGWAVESAGVERLRCNAGELSVIGMSDVAEPSDPACGSMLAPPVSVSSPRLSRLPF